MGAFKIVTGELTGKRPLGRPRRRWEVNIRMNLKEIGINTRDWIDSEQSKKTAHPNTFFTFQKYDPCQTT